jgi:iron-sulfur cluster assembly accessory protein
MADENAPVITLTEKAAAQILKIRAEEKTPDEHALRIGVRGGGCSGYKHDLSFTEVRPTDEEFELHGVRIVIDPVSLQYLAGTELDYLDGLDGTGFKFNNPQAKQTCGCGESFST